jgi:3-hydroxyisobutyrate dehydrogenase-like beta-hydroxyacid dehydrogenase
MANNDSMQPRMNEPVSPSNTVVGVVGIGDMGAALASSIVRHFPLVVFDLRAEAIEAMMALGARSAESLQVLADQCDVVLVVVVNDAQVKQVVGELLRHTGKLHTIIVSSTVLPTTVIELSEQARTVGLNLIDAPVNGGAERAVRGIINVLIGGDDDAVRRCWPIFETFGKRLFHIGPVGAGSAGKLVNNLLSLGGNMLILEAMDLARAYGISEDAATEFVTVGSGDSFGIHTWGRFDRMRRTHTLAGTPAVYEIFSKDMKVATLAAGQRNVTLPIAASMSAMIVEKAKARDKYLEEQGMTGPIPRCTQCGLELAFPYRKAGMHPLCALSAAGLAES